MRSVNLEFDKRVPDRCVTVRSIIYRLCHTGSCAGAAEGVKRCVYKVDVKLINPILISFTDILPQIGFQHIEKKGLALGRAMVVNPGVMVNIGMVGSIRGAILIGMDMEAAKQFASRMMGMEVAELDGIAQSAISEMGNMVCANACTKYNQAGIHGLDISPPTLLIGKDGQIKLSSAAVIVVNFIADGIPVDLYMGLSQ